MPQSQRVEVHLYRFLKNFRGKKLLLAVSGGLDSVAVFHAFSQVAPKHQISLAVAHIHHGWTQDAEQLQYRNACFGFTKKLSNSAGIPFFSNHRELNEPLTETEERTSEASLRAFRRQELKKIFVQTNCDYVVFAHHADDLLETRLIRLIRGTGGQGLLAMSEQHGKVLRPFLALRKKDLQHYLQGPSVNSTGPQFCADPSNRSTRYLRNWLRLKWLPLLEKQRSGAVQSLGTSLQSISKDLQQIPSLDFCFDEGRIVRSEYLTLTETDKSRVWAVYLKRQGLKNYGLSHIRELSKRLDVEQKDLTFRLLKKRWLANARHIWCESENTVE